MSKPVLIKGVTYNIIAGDRKTYVGRYVGIAPTPNMLLFDVDGQQKEFDSMQTFYSMRRDRPPRLHYTQFAKAHWSVLVYLEERVVKHGGFLDAAHLRCNPERHQIPSERSANVRPWDKKAGGTVIKGEPGLIRGYDDYDVIEDLIWGGFVCRMMEKRDAGPGTVVTDRYHMTERGWASAGGLRRYLAENEGSYDRFKPPISDKQLAGRVPGPPVPPKTKHRMFA